MEIGAHVWLRSETSRWGWVPAKITKKIEGKVGKVPVINLTLTNDPLFEGSNHGSSSPNFFDHTQSSSSSSNGYYDGGEFETTLTVDPEQLKAADHDDIKLRNLSRSYQLREQEEVLGSPSAGSKGIDDDAVVGGVDDLIGLTHLHEPAIMHALQLRYDADIIYTSTGPILIAINPFKSMPLYSEQVMEQYRIQGEQGRSGIGSEQTPFKRRTNDAIIKNMRRSKETRLPPHAYQTADDAYRAMMRGLENHVLMSSSNRGMRQSMNNDTMPANQSILVSGESGAGKTVTTKIVLNYLAMLSKVAALNNSTVFSPSKSNSNMSVADENVSIEQQVLQSNPILESFGNARTIRNDNSSRFGKYIDIRFSQSGKITGANIETYLLEKVRLIHPSSGERNYHVFYQFLTSATETEREQFYLDDFQPEDFKLLSQTGTYDRRDGVSDEKNHQEMLEAMLTIGFPPETIQSLMRLVVAILFASNMTFTTYNDDSCSLDENHAALAVASLLGVTFEDLAASITSRTINTVHENIEKQLDVEQATKACEALIKAIYGAAFDFVVHKVNDSITESKESGRAKGSASIGVLDIFGFETFQSNNFEQLCINYTNEALQQQFNKYVFKLEQLEYEKEGILWKYIAFPDNQDVLDLIDMKHTGVLAILDEQCIIPKSTDEKFTRYLYSKCDTHKRFSASSAQRVDYKFSITHYAGDVEYSTDSWLEKNKDELPTKSALLLKNSSFKLLSTVRKYVRSEERKGRGTVVTKSVGAQFSSQLKTLRSRIDVTTPHYIRCLKPNDDLVPDYFEPKNIVEQLRCGGVLEAVRVSRAGYPTRYPHDVFLARYYILGDSTDTTPMSPMRGDKDISEKEQSLKRLIAKIAFEIWTADNQMLMNLLEAERVENEMKSPKYKNQTSSANAPVYFKGSSIVNGPQSLAVESSAQTPPEKKIFKKKKNSRLSSVSIRERTEHSSNLARPETVDQFLQLDFVSRCAIAGLQLGRTKVFLRREAFDRIEAMRSHKFYGGAVKIQAMVRGKLYREKFKQMRAAAVIIQAIVRLKAGKRAMGIMRQNTAATKIQSIWRMYNGMRDMWATRMRKRVAVKKIQRAFRSYYSQKNYDGICNHAAVIIQARVRGIISRNHYYTAFFGFIRLQALVRGASARTRFQETQEEVHRERRQAEIAAAAVSPPVSREIAPEKQDRIVAISGEQSLGSASQDLYRSIKDQDWANVESIIDRNPVLAEEEEPSSGELPLHVIARHTDAWTLLVDMILVLNPKALIHRDKMGALPIHHAAAHDNLAALEIIYSAYKEGINDVDVKGRLPLHVAAEFDAVDAVKFLLSKSPEGAFTMIYRPLDGTGGGLPLHVACRSYASMGVITALLAENFASAKRCDENGDLPLHLVLKCGEVVDQVVIKTLLTCFDDAASRTDMNGDLPLGIALKNRCKPAVVNSLLMQFPNAASTLNSDGQSALHLAFEHSADDRTILGLLNHAPELATRVDKKTGLLPIQVATENEHSHFIVHNLLKRDMPVDLEEKVRAQLVHHHYSWNHVVSNTDDMYHQVVTKVLQQCTQPQVLALAHVEGPDGKIALASATPVCKHELRVMLRLFNTLEVVNQRPAYTNPLSDTQIFYALRYEPPSTSSSAFTILHEEKKDQAMGDYVEDWDDTSVVSSLSRHSTRSNMSTRSQQSIDEKLRQIRKEKGQQVIAKLTSRSDVVERELRVRKEFHLSRHYVPAVISVHHTVQHAAYSEAMAEPGYCITMEGADTTAENLMLDLRRAGQPFPVKSLKRIGISLLHMHEHGLVHCDFGTHNIGKFGKRWKLLGVGGSVSIGKPTNPNRGFYHPPESIVVENKRAALGKKAISAVVVSIPSRTTYDIWAFGVLLYEAVAGTPLPPYACRGKRAMTASEVGKIGLWDEHSLRKVMKIISDEDQSVRSLIKGLLHFNPDKRFQTMREVLEHPFFAVTSTRVRSSHSKSMNDRNAQDMMVPRATSTASGSTGFTTESSSKYISSQDFSRHSTGNRHSSYVDENIQNGVPNRQKEYSSVSIANKKSKSRNKGRDSDGTSSISSENKKSKMFGSIRNRMKNGR